MSKKPTAAQSVDESSDFKHIFNKKVIGKGAIWLSLITVGSMAAVFFYNNTENSLSAFSRVKPVFMVLCLAMVFCDLMLGSWRNHIFIRKLYPVLSHWVSFRANVANMFMGAVTPFHSGAGPGQLYVYNRNGVKVLDGFIVSLINMGSTLIFMPIAGLISILYMNDQFEQNMVSTLLKFGFTVFLTFLLVFILAFFKPVLLGKLINFITKSLGKVFISRRTNLDLWSEKSNHNILNYQQICKKLLNEQPWLFTQSLIITTLLYLNKYCMQYVILSGLGISSNLIEVISIQVLIQFMIYFAPSPGGSGFAEAGIAILFSKIVPESALSVFTLLQRSFLLFIPAVIGAVVVINLLSKHTQEE